MQFQIDFMGIGAPRSGTTWIYQCLKEHPQICVSSKKELKFFRKDNERNILEYQSFFKHCAEGKIKGEYSPTYMSYKESAFLIKKYSPNIKLIACLRNPIERAYSEYYLNKSQRKKTEESFEEFTKKYPTNIERGLYFQQLERYLKLFPRKKILILIYEDIEKNPLKFIKGVYNFLGVNPDFKPESLNEKVFPSTKSLLTIPFINESNFGKVLHFAKKHFSQSSLKILKALKIKSLANFILKKNTKEINKLRIKPIEKIPIKEEARKYLREIYRKDIKNLENLLGRDLSFWQ